MKKYIILLAVIVLAIVGYRYHNEALAQKELTVMQEILQAVNEPSIEESSGLEEENLEQYL